MAERILPVPAVKLRKAATVGKLDERIRSGVGLEALLADPIPETVVLPLDRQLSAIELSSRGATGHSFFLHLIVERSPSVLTAISFSQNQVTGPAVAHKGVIPSVDWGQNDWVRWSIYIGDNSIYYGAARHDRLLDPFSSRTYFADFRGPYRLRAIVLGSSDLDALSVAEVRLWDPSFFNALDQLELLGGRRLDGRETNLVGYWKLAEGQGTRLEDSSRFGNHGTLNGGEWLDAAHSGLQLDCSFEVLRQRREELRQRCEKIRSLKYEAAGVAQREALLPSNIEGLKQERKAIEERTEEIKKEGAEEIQALEREFAEWKKQIEDGGKVGLDDFSESVAGEVQKASADLVKEKSPYRLQSVGFEVKMLPVQREGEEDFMVTFPQLDDEQVQPGQLSTLSLSLEPRPPSPPRIEKAVPDVRGYTELAARRLLGQVGFRVDVMDQATDKEAEFDRVISQEPTPGAKAWLNQTVILLLGRASGAGSG